MHTLIKILIQTIAAFVSILAFARLLGKQQIAEITYYDYINGITFGSIAAVMATDLSQDTWQHFAGLTLFVLLTLSVQKLALINRKARRMLEGYPLIVIQHGKILENNLGKTSYSFDNIMMQLRQKGVFKVEDVAYGLLETNGQLSILLNSEQQPLTPADINLKKAEAILRKEIIVDGQCVTESLQALNLDKFWLQQTLDIFNVDKIEDVAFMAVDKNGHIYIDLYDDQLSDYLDTK